MGGVDGEPGGRRPGSLVAGAGGYPHTRMRGRRNGEHYEFDILAENGEEVVVVEVKTTLRAEDVTQFLEKLGKFTEYAPGYRGKKIYGAVAYIKADTSVQAHKFRTPMNSWVPASAGTTQAGQIQDTHRFLLPQEWEKVLCRRI